MIERALDRAHVPEEERAGADSRKRWGGRDSPISMRWRRNFRAGWRKRLAIAEALVQRPDILLLDEPTNHLDLAGIKWLEELLQNAAFACVVVSHDRYFLENVANEMVELNRAYEDGVSARVRKLQHVSRGEGRISARAAKAAGSAGKSRAHRNRMAAARPESAHHEIEGAHRQGART